MRVLAEHSQYLVASPALLAQHGAPQGPADLARLPSLDLGVPQNEHVWSLLGPDGAQATVHHRPRMVSRGMLALRAAAVAGVGVVQLPAMMIPEQLARAELVRVIPDWRLQPDIAHVVFASRRGLLPSVRALIDFLAKRFSELEDD